jgi:hypothetical protein
MVKVFIKKGDKELSHEFLFSLLNSEYGISATESDLKKTEHGKPYIENCPINFSITHSKGNIAIAFSDSDVGVDEEVVKGSFTARQIFGVTPKDGVEYALLFTKAEALVKYYAGSILLDLKKIDFSDGVVYNGEKIDLNFLTFFVDGLVLTVATKETSLFVTSL